ncbi:MAG: Inositol 2-dehydrogenase/D-chiro-inositol 3-dehydrogenase [Haliscomenobacter sp.]|jgi:predicted dehydrogenase|nr:Inositol 2-dehydrogenase/D-chiro-inositol 3-dehydrogenase [Haliscomenobacter sp.]
MKRRTFIKTTAAGTAAAALSGWSMSASSYRRILGANDRVRVAMIGCYRRFGALVDALAFAGNVDITYVCDVDQRRQNDAVGKVSKSLGKAPKAEKDMRKIAAQPDVDALFHATPDHWHAPGAILSLQAGKHAFVEKPCGHNLREDNLLIAWQKKTGLLVQMGAQQRSALESQEIIGEIHKGAIGEAYLATAFYVNNRGRVPNANKIPVPEWLDWDLFQGPAPRTDFIDIASDYNWHWFWNWGTGETGNNATHELDIARWALQVQYPEAVQVNSGKFHFKDDPWVMYDTMDATFTFPGGKIIQWDGKSRSGHPTYGSGRGTIIYGSEGSVYVDRGGYKLYNRDGKLIRERKGGDEAGTALGGGGGLTELHVINFLEAIRGKTTLTCPISIGGISNHMVHYANVSSRENDARLEIDPANGQFRNKKIMKQYWGREYEKGWEIQEP